VNKTVLRRLLEPVLYTSAAYAALADECEVTLSVGRTGQCWDNALAESFFSSLKGELIDDRAWPTRAGARRAVVDYIGWYNGTEGPAAFSPRPPKPGRLRKQPPRECQASSLT
jgi:putative transposase